MRSPGDFATELTIAVVVLYLAAGSPALVVDPLTATLTSGPASEALAVRHPWFLGADGRPLAVPELPPARLALQGLAELGGITALAIVNLVLVGFFLLAVHLAARSPLRAIGGFVAVVLVVATQAFSGPYLPSTVALACGGLFLAGIAGLEAGGVVGRRVAVLSGPLAALSVAGILLGAVLAAASPPGPARRRALGAWAAAVVLSVGWLTIGGSLDLALAAIFESPTAAPLVLPPLPPYTMELGLVFSVAVATFALFPLRRMTVALGVAVLLVASAGALSEVVLRGGIALTAAAAVAVLLGRGMARAIENADRLKVIAPDISPRRAVTITALLLLLPGVLLPAAYGALNPKSSEVDIADLSAARREAALWLSREGRPGLRVLGAPGGFLSPGAPSGILAAEDSLAPALASARSLGEALAVLHNGGVGYLWLEPSYDMPGSPRIPAAVIGALAVTQSLPVAHRNGRVEIREVGTPEPALVDAWVVSADARTTRLTAPSTPISVEPAWRWRQTSHELELVARATGYMIVHEPYPQARLTGFAVVLNGSTNESLRVHARDGNSHVHVLDSTGTDEPWRVAYAAMTGPPIVAASVDGRTEFQFVFEATGPTAIRAVAVFFGKTPNEKAVEDLLVSGRFLDP